MRSRSLTGFVMVCVLAAGTAFAAGEDGGRKQGPTISEWLKSVQQKIASIVPKKSLSMNTGVAGVRGAKEDSQAHLYWKGKKSDDAVSEEELAEFRTAVELASKGERAAAAKELEEFMTEFPDSPLIPDAKKTLELVRAEPEPQPLPELQEQQKPVTGEAPAADAAPAAAPETGAAKQQ